MPNALEWQSYLDNQARQALAPARERIAENLANYRQEQADKRAQQGSVALADLQARAAMERTLADARARIEQEKIEQYSANARAMDNIKLQEDLAREGRLHDEATLNAARLFELDKVAAGLGISRKPGQSYQLLLERIAEEQAKLNELQRQRVREASLTADTRTDLTNAASEGRLSDDIINSIQKDYPKFAETLRSLQGEAVRLGRIQYESAKNNPYINELLRRQAIAKDPTIYYYDQIKQALSDDGVLIVERLYDALKYNNLNPGVYGLPSDNDSLQKFFNTNANYDPALDYEIANAAPGDKLRDSNVTVNKPQIDAAKDRLEQYYGVSKALQALADRVHRNNQPTDGTSGKITVSDPWGLLNKVTIQPYERPEMSQEELEDLQLFSDLQQRFARVNERR